MRRIVRTTCGIATITLAGCGSPAGVPPGAPHATTLPSAAPLVSAALAATPAARPPTRPPPATAVPTYRAPTRTVQPTATDPAPTALPATRTPTAQATVRPILSESNTRLTIPVPDGVTLRDFTISPDRQSVVYVVAGQSRATIFGVPLRGGIPVRLGELVWQERSDVSYRAPSAQYVITPDSQAVIFQDADGLYRVPLAGGTPHLLGTGLGAGGAAGPSTSESNPSLHNEVPDFRLYPACGCLIYRTTTTLSVITLDGAPIQIITNTLGRDSYLYAYVVSADGRRLIYDVRRFDPWDTPKTPSWGPGLIKIMAVYSAPLKGGAPISLATAPTAAGAVNAYTISPTGKELFYATYDDDGEGSVQGYRSWHVPITGGTPTPRSLDP